MITINKKITRVSLTLLIIISLSFLTLSSSIQITAYTLSPIPKQRVGYAMICDSTKKESSFMED